METEKPSTSTPSLSNTSNSLEAWQKTKEQVGVCRRQICLIPPTPVVTSQPLEREETLQKGITPVMRAQPKT